MRARYDAELLPFIPLSAPRSSSHIGHGKFQSSFADSCNLGTWYITVLRLLEIQNYDCNDLKEFKFKALVH